MRSFRLPFRLAGGALLCALLLTSLPTLAQDDDLRALQGVEKAARQKSLALLAVLKSMGPEFGDGTETATMGRVVSAASEVRQSRSLESRVIFTPNLNDEFEILDEDDNLLRIALPDGRTGWIDESHLQRFEENRPSSTLSFHGADPQELRRYAIVIDELLAGIDEDKEKADALFFRLLPPDGEPKLTDPDDVRIARASHARVVEYQAYAHRFHRKYILGYDFSLKNERAFLDNLSAWADLLLGKSSFTTTTLIPPDGEDKTETDESLQQISLGGELDIDERSSVRAEFSNKKEVNQTAYTTNTAAAGYRLQWSGRTQLDLGVDTYAFADDVNTFNDFRRTTFKAGSLIDGDGRSYDLNYDFTTQSFEENDTEDFAGHALDLAGRWKRGRTGKLRARMQAVFQSSDVAFHDFTHLTPSLEYSKRSGPGRTTWRGVYEMLDYKEADLRSFGRAQLTYERNSNDGPRRNRSAYSLTHKNFPDNELSTYAQFKAAWQRNRTADGTTRKSLTTYTNFYPDNTDNNYTDVRVSRRRSAGGRFLDINLYSRIWHQPGGDDSTSVAKPYVVDLYGRGGWVRGNVRFGPTVGLHLVAAKGQKVIERDGNLVRVGAKIEGTFQLPNRIRMTLDASYDYGFVYSNEIAVDAFGTVTVGDATQRHPTTFQVNAFAARPIGRNFDLTSRLTLYRIATDMDETLSINPVTNNDRFTLFVGVRYRHN